jgi:hypothetical protein
MKNARVVGSWRLPPRFQRKDWRPANVWQDQDPCRQPEREMHEAVRMKSKLQWRSRSWRCQELGTSAKESCRERVWPAQGKSHIGCKHQGHWGRDIPIHWSSDHTTTFPGCWTWTYGLGCFPCWAQSCFSPTVPCSSFEKEAVLTTTPPTLSLPFWMGMFTLCHYVFASMSLSFLFYRAHAWICLESQKRLRIGTSEKAGTLPTLGTLGDGPNAFCVTRWPWAFGGRGGTFSFTDMCLCVKLSKGRYDG